MKFDGKDIKVVWVDLDDTLIDFRANSRSALTHLFYNNSLGRFWPDAEAWYECYEKHNKALWSEYNVGRISRDYLMMERFRRPLVEAGWSNADAREASPRLSDEYLDLLAAEKRTVDGARELLEGLRRCGVTVGVLSNGFREVQFRKMRSAGLEPLIDLTVLSDDIGVNKPDTRLYRHAMERAGVADPSAHLMIGDNPDTDIRGALDAGWSAIAYRPPHAGKFEVAGRCHVADDLRLIADLLGAALPK